MKRLINIALPNLRKYSGILHHFPLNAVTRETEWRLLDTQIKK